MNDDLHPMYTDLKAVASEHGTVPAFKFTEGDKPGRVVLVRLMLDPQANGFARLVIHDGAEPPSEQYLVEIERLRALIDYPA